MHTQLKQRPIGALCLFLLFLLTSGLGAQSTADPEPRLEVEVEPAASLFGGYAFNFGCRFRHLRISARSYAYHQRRFFIGEEAFSLESSGIGFALDYVFFRGNSPYIGLQSEFVTDQVFAQSLTGNGVQSSINAGLRLGYRYHFGKADDDYRGLYVSPGVVLARPLEASEVEVAGHAYAPKKFFVIPALCVGYRF